MGALLEVTAPPDRLWLLAVVAEVSMHHPVVTFPPAAILGVLDAWRGMQSMGAGVLPAPHPIPLLHPYQDACAQMSPLRWDPSSASSWLAEDAYVSARPTPTSLLGSPSLPWGAHTERGRSRLSLPPTPSPCCSPKNPGQGIGGFWGRHRHEHLLSD